MQYPRSVRPRSVWAFSFLLFIAGTTFAASGVQGENPSGTPSTAAGSAKYVGTEQCKICHEDQARMMQSTPHYRIFGSEKSTGAEGCEFCHGPGSAHIDRGGDKDAIFRLGGKKPEEVSGICLKCHLKSATQAHFKRSAHARAGITCVDCHRVHRAKTDPLLSEKQPGLCYKCHQDTQADFSKPFHHRVDEGSVKCSDCHNVHATSERHLRNTANRDRVCYQCHSEQRGPFVYQHEPVRSEGCAACHTPHGSANARLLTRSETNSLCLECHQNIPAGPHPQNTSRQSCTLCHVAIHGSNSSTYLFK